MVSESLPNSSPSAKGPRPATSPSSTAHGAAPGLFWLGGFRSDMAGTKATALDAFAARHGLAATRFDYSGHGESGGDFAEGTISRWLEEATRRLRPLRRQPRTIVVGSSMGGWLALLLAERAPRKRAARRPRPDRAGRRHDPGADVGAVAEEGAHAN